MEKRKTLLERYGIPINYLDFAHIAKSEDAREMEKIVHILRSGEEGYFPDLTKCAEQRLQQLKPDSRLFRYEEQLRGRDCLGAAEWKPIFDWTNDIKHQDTELALLKQHENAGDEGDGLLLHLPPVRKGGTITPAAEQPVERTQPAAGAAQSKTAATKRAPATDYRKWDKFDADEEILRMDLAEERVAEEVERKNQLNLRHANEVANSDAAAAGEALDDARLLQKLSDFERARLAEEYRLRGNDYFRTKEYENASAEYGRAIKMAPGGGAAAAYNNRAIANIKMHKYLEAMGDCEQCLLIEPNNLKARMRLADANLNHGRRREAYDLYQRVLDVEPSNAVALKAMQDIRGQLGDLAPPNATRLQIQEASVQPDKAKSSAAKCAQQAAAKVAAKVNAKATAATQSKEYDLVNLVLPNRVVKSKLATAAAALNGLKATAGQCKTKPAAAPMATKAAVPELRLPLSSGAQNADTRVLIEEI